jgi:endonuclease/exonuclease/phosphatase family metal-dependent hydrolase
LKSTANISFFVISLAILFSSLIPPDYFWIAGFLAYGIPIILFLNLFLAIWSAYKKKKSAVYPLVILVLGYGFIRDTFRIHNKDTGGDLKVITYNTRVFNVYFNNGKDTSSVRKMIEWINNENADVICCQEFYNDPGSSNFNTLRQIRDYNDYNFYNSPKVTNRIGAEFGDIIFSKYPIVKSGEISFGNNTLNKVIYADIKIKSDTVRIYNMHLQSMHIREDELINTEDFQLGFKQLVSNLKNGFIQRARQIRILKKELKACPHPIILCGDLNDLPYSYAYRELDADLNNGFTKAGNGFGFTFNGKLFFLRIDNQFFSRDLMIHSYRTHRDMKCSDHFPVSATYSLNRTSD